MQKKIPHVRYQDGTPAFKAAFDAAFPGLPQGMTIEEAERRMTAALIAYYGARLSAQAEYEAKKALATKAVRLGHTLGDALSPNMKRLGEEVARAGAALSPLAEPQPT